MEYMRKGNTCQALNGIFLQAAIPAWHDADVANARARAKARLNAWFEGNL
jgi:hypothetical protein